MARVLQGGQEGPGGGSMRIDIDKTCDELESRIVSGESLGYETGEPFVDEVVGPLIKGNIYMAVAHPKVGKTRFALSHVALPLARQGLRVVFWSLEIGGPELIDYSLAPIILRRERPLKSWEPGVIPQVKRILATEYPGLLVYGVDVGPGRKDSVETCYKLIEEDKADALIVDNFGFLSRQTLTKRNEEGALSEKLKVVAVRKDIPIMVLVHPRKEMRVEGEVVESPPTAHDVRGDSAVAADATAIVALHRPLVDSDNMVSTMRSPLTMFYSCYQRNAADGKSVDLYFEGGTFRWRRATDEDILKHAPQAGRGKQKWAKKVEVAHRRVFPSGKDRAAGDLAEAVCGEFGARKVGSWNLK